MFSQRYEAPYLWKSNNLRQFAPYRVTKKVYFKFVVCIVFIIKCKKKKIKKHFNIYSNVMTMNNLVLYYVSLIFIFEKKNTLDSVFFVYSYSTIQVNVTSKFLYVPGQKSPPMTLFDTTARFSITLFSYYCIWWCRLVYNRSLNWYY